MVLIFSASANQSKQIHREVQRAFDREVPVLPFRIENIAPEKSLAYYILADGAGLVAVRRLAPRVLPRRPKKREYSRQFGSIWGTSIQLCG